VGNEPCREPGRPADAGVRDGPVGGGPGRHGRRCLPASRRGGGDRVGIVPYRRDDRRALFGPLASAIAYSLGDNLLTRAADVTLKERRPLVLMVRETPLTLGHLRAMTAATESGAIVMPPVPAWYLCPASVQDIVEHSAARALDLLGVDVPNLPRWGETTAEGEA